MLQSSRRRGGKAKKCLGQKLGWTSVYPTDLFSPQIESKPVQTRTQQSKCFSRGRGGARDALLVCWRKWLEGRRKKEVADKGDHCREKWGFDTGQKFSQHLQGAVVLKRWVMPPIWHLANITPSHISFFYLTSSMPTLSKECPSRRLSRLADFSFRHSLSSSTCLFSA